MLIVFKIQRVYSVINLLWLSYFLHDNLKMINLLFYIDV